MKRMKRHKVKTEVPETSTSHSREQEVHDLAYYIHDRVELMHQVFSVLKYKELKVITPACVRNISIDDLQELCTEELLGISSKRLCAILDGAEPPSDTESSSPSPPPEQLETISLDSISSDDEILSQSSSKKKKHKHRHRESKSKRKKSRDQDDGEVEKSKASRAGLTVLELLELQARARAIRAQLQQEQEKKQASEPAATEPPHSSDNEVEIKEEPAEVVEISSDEEKPNIELLQKELNQETIDVSPQQPSPVTKRINDLVITVPQQSKQKIKLNRNKSTPTPVEITNTFDVTQKSNDKVECVATTKTSEKAVNIVNDKSSEKTEGTSRKEKIKKKKKTKKRVNKDDDDNDEITLQLSDTEKMDLLEDLDRVNYDSVSSDTSSDSSSDSDVPKKRVKENKLKEEEITPENSKDCEDISEKVSNVPENIETKTIRNETVNSNKEDANEMPSPASKKENNNDKCDNINDKEKNIDKNENINDRNEDVNVKDNNLDENMEIDIAKSSSTSENSDNNCVAADIAHTSLETEMEIPKENGKCKEKDLDAEKTDLTVNENVDETAIENKDKEIKDKDKEIKDTDKEIKDKELSEGELSDRESSEVEAVDLKPEVVCISDEESSTKCKKKKKKKDKKSKKEKKMKKKSGFRESADQNFFKDDVKIIEISSQEKIETSISAVVIVNHNQSNSSISDGSINKKLCTQSTHETINKVDLAATDNNKQKNIDIGKTKSNSSNKDIKNEVGTVINSDNSTPSILENDNDDLYEILELSDDSSCYEVECTLSKEPTTLEIEALSAQIDDIYREEVITEEEIRNYERITEESKEDIENISWKDRYLDSNKVKRVMYTANIFNALRKKNRELKRKLAESKKKIEENDHAEAKKADEEPESLEEGSIEQYNTLEGSTKYVDPIKEANELPGDLKKDAKLLLKMYKKLLKYNDMNKQGGSSKKIKKKKKNKKNDETKDRSVNSKEIDRENVKDSPESASDKLVTEKRENLVQT